MRSASAHPSTLTSAVRLRCQDSERQRSPDAKHHERLSAEHLRHVPAGQRTVLHECQKGYRSHQRCRRTSSTIGNSAVDPAATSDKVAELVTSHWRTVWENEESGAFYRHLQSDVGYKIKYRMQPQRKDTTITRRCQGYSMTNARLHTIGIRDNPDCVIH